MKKIYPITITKLLKNIFTIFIFFLSMEYDMKNNKKIFKFIEKAGLIFPVIDLAADRKLKLKNKIINNIYFILNFLFSFKKTKKVPNK
jgi:hypothetical protein